MSPFDIACHAQMRYNGSVKENAILKEQQLNISQRPAPAGFFNASFLMVPKKLLCGEEFSGMSLCAKILYSLMKDRLSLSEKNGWRDRDGRSFIYFKQTEAAAVLGCGKRSVTRYMRELEEYGLIQKRAQGLCKPDMIYVNGLTEPGEMVCSENSEAKEVCPTEDCSELMSKEERGRQKMLLITRKNGVFGGAKTAFPEAQNLHPNNTEKSYTENSHTQREKNGKRQSVFRPPTVNEVKKYCREGLLDIDAEYFVNFYEAKGWLVGRSRMKDWRAMLRKWQADDMRRGKQKSCSTGKTQLELRHGYDVGMLQRALFGEDG